MALPIMPLAFGVVELEGVDELDEVVLAGVAAALVTAPVPVDEALFN
jgi:hypothetical protein